MKYQLILQWPVFSIEDYDSMIEVENLLIDALQEDGEVDGHDAGSGEVNIFILTDTPERTFENVKNILTTCGLLTHLRAAFRDVGQNRYRFLWPSGLKEFSVS